MDISQHNQRGIMSQAEHLQTPCMRTRTALRELNIKSMELLSLGLEVRGSPRQPPIPQAPLSTPGLEAEITLKAEMTFLG